MASGDFLWPDTLQSGTANVLEGITTNSVFDYKWIVVLGGFLAFAMAWGIGANDVANAFATSVGAGSLSLRWACAIAAVMEFLGALLMGSNVTDTVRKKIIEPAVFDPAQTDGAANGPEILMTGFLVALIAATTWLITATYFGLPVSTTHSIIGSLIGVGLAYRGSEAVVWISKGSGFSKLKGVVGVVLSWIISPVLSGILAIIVFLIVRHLVLRTKNPVRNGFIFLPFFYALTVAVTLFFIIYKGSPKLKLDKRYSVGEAIGIAVGGGAAVALFSWWFVIPQAKRYIDRWEQREIEKLKNPEEITEEPDKINRALGKVGINFELKEEISDDVVRMHDNVEKFDPKAEQLFTWLQIFTAAFDAFAHGANDVANSIGPFASIFQLHNNNGQISEAKESEFKKAGTFSGGGQNDSNAYAKEDPVPDGNAFCSKETINGEDVTFIRCVPRFPYFAGNAPNAQSRNVSLYNSDGEFQEEATCYSQCNPGCAAAFQTRKQAVDLWILALGGFGIVLGLAMWGYRIIVAIGVKLTKLTPSRGFAIEIGAAVTVIIASRIGLPVSTTHCQVGATMGVGLVEFKGNTVNWKQFLFICAGWVFTVIFTGLLSAGIFSLLINSPQEFKAQALVPPVHCPGERMFVYDPAANGFRGIGCSGFPAN